jgi:nucleotide-binding universal stress UspA family protein
MQPPRIGCARVAGVLREAPAIVMSNARRIFVALDTSDSAKLVLEAASKLAALTDGTLIVFRAVGISPDLPHEVFEVTDARLEEVLLRNAHADLEHRVRGIERVEKLHTVFGTAWDAICREAKELGADLIVIGSHGHSRFARMMGTTAAKVVNNADRNVLVVRTAL